MTYIFYFIHLSIVQDDYQLIMRICSQLKTDKSDQQRWQSLRIECEYSSERPHQCRSFKTINHISLRFKTNEVNDPKIIPLKIIRITSKFPAKTKRQKLKRVVFTVYYGISHGIILFSDSCHVDSSCASDEKTRSSPTENLFPLDVYNLLSY